jgi:ethanolamine ammonia-lyase small subunit
MPGVGCHWRRSAGSRGPGAGRPRDLERPKRLVIPSAALVIPSAALVIPSAALVIPSAARDLGSAGPDRRGGGNLKAEPTDDDRPPLDVPALIGAIEGAGLQAVHVRSLARDRDSFLRAPELGGRLDPESLRRLRAQSGVGRDAVLVLADGVKARAAETHALPVLRLAVPRLEAAGWLIGPVIVAEPATLELGDEIGAAIGAHLAVVLLGEPDAASPAGSLAIYLTWNPAPGRTSRHRSRIGGVGPGRTPSSYQAAADALVRLMNQARARRATGAALTDDTGASGA